MIKQLLEKLNLKAKKNFIIYGVGQAFNLLSPLLVAPYIVQKCHIEGFGKVGLGFALSLFLILIVDYAFDINGTKQVAENRDNPKQLERILFTTLYTKFFLFFIAFTVGVLLVTFIPFFNFEKKLFLCSLTIVFAQVFNPIWFLQGIENFTLASVVNIFSKTIYIILVFNFINQENDYFLVNFLLGISSLFCNFSTLFVIKNKYKFNLIKINLKAIKTIIKDDFSFCISQLFLSTRQLSPMLLSSYFLGFSIAGQYKIAEQIVTFFRTFIQVYLKYFFPSVCYKIKESTNEGVVYWKKYVLLNFVLVLVALLIMYYFTVPILHFFNVTETNLISLKTIFRATLIIPLLMSLSLYLEQLMFITNKSKVYIKIAIFVTFINVLLIIILVNYFQLIGVIVAVVVSEILFIVLYFYKGYLQLNKKSINLISK